MLANPLHRARLERGITLEHVVSRTCLSPRIVQLLDAGHFADLPGGLYARSYVRTFAAVVGLNPETAVAELGDRLPSDVDPMPVLREHARLSLSPLVLDATNFAGGLKTRIASGMAMRRPRLPRVAGDGWMRTAAVVLDVAILAALYACVIGLTAWTMDLSVRETTALAGLQVAAVCALVALPCAAVLGSLGGRWLGRAFRIAPRHAAPVPHDGLEWEHDRDRLRAGC